MGRGLMESTQNQTSNLLNEVGLGLSGGGYRATLFHLGTFWWFCEHEKLRIIDRVAGVSGGAITAALVGLKWKSIQDVPSYKNHVVTPIRTLTSTTIDRGSILKGLLFPGSVGQQISKKYAKILYGKATLQDLPDNTRFIINSTNVGTGKLWRFSKPYMGDYQVGLINEPKVSLANAVTASSAFPPILSPFTLKVRSENFNQEGDLRMPELQKNITLTDGGVYDNLGLEAIEKRCQTVLVSDAGGTVPVDITPAKNWLSHTKRVMGIIHGQVAGQRRRELVENYVNDKKLSLIHI